MKDYRLTAKGKVVLGIFIVLLLCPIVISGIYINDFMFGNLRDDQQTNNDKDYDHEVDETDTTDITDTSNTTDITNNTSTSDIADTTEIESSDTISPSEATSEASETSNTTEPSIQNPSIYTLNDIDDLGQFMLSVYFTKDSDILEMDDSLLQQVSEIIDKYPNERISIEGHVNGYPNYKSIDKDYTLSNSRAQAMMNVLIELGVNKNQLTIYSNGSERQSHKDFGNQHLNDRVEVYFSDHYIRQNQGK